MHVFPLSEIQNAYVLSTYGVQNNQSSHFVDDGLIAIANALVKATTTDLLAYCGSIISITYIALFIWY
jgi:hypothetical protein